jgi:hypothetical protein
MITQIIWLACLPALIFISYQLIVFVYNRLEKKHNM